MAESLYHTVDLAAVCEFYEIKYCCRKELPHQTYVLKQWRTMSEAVYAHLLPDWLITTMPG